MNPYVYVIGSDFTEIHDKIKHPIFTSDVVPDKLIVRFVFEKERKLFRLSHTRYEKDNRVLIEIRHALITYPFHILLEMEPTSHPMCDSSLNNSYVWFEAVFTPMLDAARKVVYRYKEGYICSKLECDDNEESVMREKYDRNGHIAKLLTGKD